MVSGHGSELGLRNDVERAGARRWKRGGQGLREVWRELGLGDGKEVSRGSGRYGDGLRIAFFARTNTGVTYWL